MRTLIHQTRSSFLPWLWNRCRRNDDLLARWTDERSDTTSLNRRFHRRRCCGGGDRLSTTDRQRNWNRFDLSFANRRMFFATRSFQPPIGRSENTVARCGCRSPGPPRMNWKLSLLTSRREKSVTHCRDSERSKTRFLTEHAWRGTGRVSSPG